MARPSLFTAPVTGKLLVRGLRGLASLTWKGWTDRRDSRRGREIPEVVWTRIRGHEKVVGMLVFDPAEARLQRRPRHSLMRERIKNMTKMIQAISAAIPTYLRPAQSGNNGAL
jgi:hypothetical protein